MTRPDCGMSCTGIWIAVLGALMVILAGATGGFASLGPSRAGREITIVAKDMAFVIESPTSSQQANPTITVKAGQKITIVLRNDHPGLRPALRIQGLAVQL